MGGDVMTPKAGVTGVDAGTRANLARRNLASADYGHYGDDCGAADLRVRAFVLIDSAVDTEPDVWGKGPIPTFVLASHGVLRQKSPIKLGIPLGMVAFRSPVSRHVEARKNPSAVAAG